MSERQDAASPVWDPTIPEYSTRPVAFRRPDVLAGLLLILAGVAGAVSLLLPWLKRSGATGWTLVRKGLRDVGDAVDSGLWQPVAIVLAGGVLLVIGLLLLLPARSHRFLGLVALLVGLLAAAGVLVPLYQAHWHLTPFDTGFWFAMAVVGLGILGSLKALLTGRKYA
jgi:hypothetical protein